MPRNRKGRKNRLHHYSRWDSAYNREHAEKGRPHNQFTSKIDMSEQLMNNLIADSKKQEDDAVFDDIERSFEK